jgi:hypothetical protein
MNTIIHYYSTLYENGGYGEAARGYIKAVDRYVRENNIKDVIIIPQQPASSPSILDKDINTIRSNNIERASSLQDKVDVLIAHIQPNIASNSEIELASLIKKSHLFIYNTVFECDDIPEHYVLAIQNVTGVIVPSKLCLDAFSKHHSNVICIPHYIEEFSDDNSIVFDTEQEKKAFLNPKGMRLLTILSQNTDRKGLDLLLSSYVSEFSRKKDNIELLIKANCRGYKDVASINSIIEHIKSLFIWKGQDIPAINVIPNVLDRNSMGAIYRSASATVCTSKGEGFCLPLAESLMNEVPVIYTSWGGHVDYLMNEDYNDNGFGYPIYYILDSVISSTYPWDMTHAKWAIPIISSIRSNLREAYYDWTKGTLSNKGKLGKQYLTQHMSYNLIGKSLIDFIQKEVYNLNY